MKERKGGIFVHIHVVQKGETPWQLSQRYGVNINQILLLNQLPNENSLVIGQALLIPDPESEHVFQRGDRVESIAQRYGITAQELLKMNGIANAGLIYPGQVLEVPHQHKVLHGETLPVIARKYGTSVQTIVSLNHLSATSSIQAGQVLRLPGKSKPAIEVNAFTEPSAPGSLESRHVSPYLTFLSPFGYRMHVDGSLEPINDTAMVQSAIANHVVPIMAITNFSTTDPGTKTAHAILSNPAVITKLLDNVVSTMKTKGYRGLNIDFENVRQDDRELYNQFLRKAVDRLHPEGHFVSSSLAPKTSAGQKGLLYEAHDYKAHGEILDFVVLMTYEWGYRFGPPQSISPINQIKAVLDYAVTVIPRNKIFMGFQVYARDWVLPHVEHVEAETFSMQEAVKRAVQHGAAIQYDHKTETPFFRYADSEGKTHEVWFEDARSAQAKFDLVKEYKLRGVSYWVLGYPFPQNWALLADNFTIIKK
jgi:spore germination protein